MSNLLKGTHVVRKDERVIDYNEVIKSKLDNLLTAASKGKPGADGFTSGLHADVVERLLDTDSDEAVDAEDSQAEEFNFEAFNEKAEEILSDARAEADRIIADASVKGAQILAKAQAEGMEQGLAAARQEIETKKTMLEKEFSEKNAELKREYDELKAKMEPELVATLSEVFKNVIHAYSDENEEMVINLINSVMHNADSGREFKIKVSPEDYKFVINNQGKIYCAMSKDIQLEIIEDTNLTRNQCIIENESGVYDCSLDIQLEKLIKNIKLLSCI